VLSTRLVRRYFGDSDPLGQTLIADGETPMIVTGVLEEVQGNSHLEFHYLVSLSTLLDRRDDLATDWGALFFPTFVQLDPAASVAAVSSKLSAFTERHQRAEGRYGLQLEPLTDLYLHSQRLGQTGPRGNPDGTGGSSVV
jgi:putative ABC transport system permease protein